MKETFEDYLQRLKGRRTEDDYKYNDGDFEKYKDYIRDCWKGNLSVYKCLEWMSFEKLDIGTKSSNTQPNPETTEEYFLSSIKNVLEYRNDVQAIRLMEKYFEAKKDWEIYYKEKEVYNICSELCSYFIGGDTFDLKEWFKQFKKK